MFMCPSEVTCYHYQNLTYDITSSNVACSRHNIAGILLICRYITIIHSLHNLQSKSKPIAFNVRIAACGKTAYILVVDN